MKTFITFILFCFIFFFVNEVALANGFTTKLEEDIETVKSDPVLKLVYSVIAIVIVLLGISIFTQKRSKTPNHVTWGTGDSKGTRTTTYTDGSRKTHKYKNSGFMFVPLYIFDLSPDEFWELFFSPITAGVALMFILLAVAWVLAPKTNKKEPIEEKSNPSAEVDAILKQKDNQVIQISNTDQIQLGSLVREFMIDYVPLVDLSDVDKIRKFMKDSYDKTIDFLMTAKSANSDAYMSLLIPNTLPASEFVIVVQNGNIVVLKNVIFEFSPNFYLVFDGKNYNLISYKSFSNFISGSIEDISSHYIDFENILISNTYISKYIRNVEQISEIEGISVSNMTVLTKGLYDYLNDVGMLYSFIYADSGGQLDEKALVNKMRSFLNKSFSSPVAFRSYKSIINDALERVSITSNLIEISAILADLRIEMDKL
jgi:hypothetical protein